MSILIPVYSKGITLNELPDHISVYFEIANCKQRCKGCHSPWLQENAPKMSIEEIAQYAEQQVDRGADAIILMGGTTNGILERDLKALITYLNNFAPVCLYSGSDDIEADLDLMEHSSLTWLKTGSYQEAKGGLDVDTTNQRFYKQEFYPTFKSGEFAGYKQKLFDLTHIFFKQHEKS